MGKILDKIREVKIYDKLVKVAEFIADAVQKEQERINAEIERYKRKYKDYDSDELYRIYKNSYGSMYEKKAIALILRERDYRRPDTEE